jgi:hypothetical protein
MIFVIIICLIILIIVILLTKKKSINTTTNNLATTSNVTTSTSTSMIIIKVEIDPMPASNDGMMEYLFNGSNNAPLLEYEKTYKFILSNNIIKSHPFGIWDITTMPEKLIIISDASNNTLLFKPVTGRKYKFRCEHHGKDNSTDQMKGNFNFLNSNPTFPSTQKSYPSSRPAYSTFPPTKPLQISPIEITVTNNQSMSWQFSGYTGDNPTVTLKSNTLYKFIFAGQVSDHSFRIVENTIPVAMPDLLTGNILFTPVKGGTYFYKCKNHSAMAGSFIIV